MTYFVLLVPLASAKCFDGVRYRVLCLYYVIILTLFHLIIQAVASTAGLTLANALDAMKMPLAYGLS